ncbi:MAG: HlyD family efflux transporter periplasmic adaptor subunit [Chlorobi bacterium]|nr:HlyD family efflux transporter periplasmic adaptor subunit [Chlorobiota bacterium]
MNEKVKIIFFNMLVILLLFSAVLIQGCSDQSKEDEKAHVENPGHDEEGHDENGHEENGHEEDDVVQLSPDELKEFGIELAKAGPGQLKVHVDLTGEIVIDPDRLAHIIPRFPGIVKEVRKKIGDKVKKDEVLAIIESNESLVPYEVKSLADGTVIEMHLSLGEVINDATHAFVVADLSHVWANLNIYQKDLQYIRVGQEAVITAGPEMPRVVGRISYISPVVEEDTRTALARVVIPNPDGRWRPGLFIRAEVVKERANVDIVVPKTALEMFENQTVVFVQTPEGFRPQPVVLGRSNSQMVEIVAGLRAGQEYVAKGGFTIRSELQKKAFGGGHGH